MNKKSLTACAVICTLCVLSMVLFSCKKQEQSMQIPSSRSMSPVVQHEVKELVNPVAMHAYKDKVVLFNSSSSRIPLLSVYDGRSLEFLYSAIVQGRGAQEVSNGVNPYYFEKTDNGFILNTRDHMALTEFVWKGDSIWKKGRETLISHEALNSLNRLNDSLFVFNRMGGEKLFGLLNRFHPDNVTEFGNYPKAHVNFRKPEDRKKYYANQAVLTDAGHRMLVFYQFVPLMQIYEGTKLVKEIKYQARTSQATSIDDINSQSAEIGLYFYSPKVAGDHIYVMYMDKTAKEMGESMSLHLLKMDFDGKVLCSYDVGFSMIWTVSDDGQFYYTYREDGNTSWIDCLKL